MPRGGGISIIADTVRQSNGKAPPHGYTLGNIEGQACRRCTAGCSTVFPDRSAPSAFLELGSAPSGCHRCEPALPDRVRRSGAGAGLACGAGLRALCGASGCAGGGPGRGRSDRINPGGGLRRYEGLGRLERLKFVEFVVVGRVFVVVAASGFVERGLPDRPVVIGRFLHVGWVGRLGFGRGVAWLEWGWVLGTHGWRQRLQFSRGQRRRRGDRSGVG